MILSRWSVGAFFVMQSLATSVFAIQYSPDISNCDIVNIGPNQWQAKYRISIDICGFCEDSTNNTHAIYVPQVGTDGKPIEKASVAGWSNIEISNDLTIKYVEYEDGIYFTGKNGRVIKNSSNYSVNFSTAGNNAYPLLHITVQDRYGGGGATYGYSYWISKGKCYGTSGGNAVFPPIDEVIPPEPNFSMKSAVWELNEVDVGDLPDVNLSGNGSPAIIKNVMSNNLCFSYATAGVKKNSYALSVSNSTSSQGGRNLFVMRGGNSQLPYSLALKSNDGITANNFTFPTAGANFITLSQVASSVNKRSEMCWTPQVNLFKNAATNAGMHTDTINFIIIPKA